MKIRHILCTAIMALIVFSCSDEKGETNQVGTRKAVIDTSDMIRKSDLENNKLRKDFASFESNAERDYYFVGWRRDNSRRLSEMTKRHTEQLRSFIVYDTVPTDQGLCFLDPELWFFDQNGETTTSLKPQEPVIYSTAERCHIVTFPVATLLPHLLNSENASLALKCTSNLAHDRKHPVIQILYVPLTEEGFPRRLLEDYKTCYNGNFSSLNEFFFKWPSCNK